LFLFGFFVVVVFCFFARAQPLSPSFHSAKNKFQTLDKKGQGLDEAAADGIDSTHQNVIGQISIHSGDRAGASVVSTVGMDGVLVLWDLAVCASVSYFMSLESLMVWGLS
jgi:hypothetical protein